MQLVQFLVAWGDNKSCFARSFFLKIAFRAKKSAQESGQTWGFKFVAKKNLTDRYGTVTGPSPEKSETSSFHLHSKGKPKKSEILPWPDRDGTMTARFWNSKLAVLCTMPSPSSRLSNGGGNMIPK